MFGVYCYLFINCTNPVSEQSLAQTAKDTSINVDTNTVVDAVLIGEDTVAAIDTPSVLILPCSNGYDYGMYGYDLDEVLEENLSKVDRIKVLPFSYLKFRKAHYHGVYDKKYCDGILALTEADYLIMNRMKGNLVASPSSKGDWGYSIRILNTKTLEQVNSINASNLSGWKEVLEHLEKAQATLIEDIQSN